MRIGCKYLLSVLAIARELLTTPPLIAIRAGFWQGQGGEHTHVHLAVTPLSLSRPEGTELQWPWEGTGTWRKMNQKGNVLCKCLRNPSRALEEGKEGSASAAGQGLPRGLVFGNTTLPIVLNNLCHFVYCFSAS